MSTAERRFADELSSRFFSPTWIGRLAGIVSALILLTDVSAAELQLKFRDEAGQAVRPTSAELLLVAWGDAVRLNLESGVLERSYGSRRMVIREGAGGLTLALGKPLVLPLDEAWLHSRWPERFQDMSGVYLYFMADGYVPIRSERFLWIGSHGDGFGPRISDTEIRFPGRNPVKVTEGQSAECELVFRRPRDRFIRLVDDDAQPVPGVKVTTYMYWSAENHCGALSGADPMGFANSGEDGRVQVPDGDYQYAIVFEKELYVLNEPDAWSDLPPRLIIYLTKPETTLKLHRWRRRPLEIEVTTNDDPSPGLGIYGCLARCSCGACCGPLARHRDQETHMETDTNGRFNLSDFYPEEFDRVFISNDAGKEIWSEDPRKWPATGIIRARLHK